MLYANVFLFLIIVESFCKLFSLFDAQMKKYECCTDFFKYARFFQKKKIILSEKEKQSSVYCRIRGHVPLLQSVEHILNKVWITGNVSGICRGVWSAGIRFHMGVQTRSSAVTNVV